MRLARLAGLTTAGLLALAVAAPVGAAADAHVRVLHGSPDAPNVDVYADGAKIVDNLAFGEITAYLAIPGTTYVIRVCAAGSDGTVDGNCPIIADLTFDAGKKYTVAASDLVAQIKANVFVDGNGKAGVARARVVHLSADTPTIDVLAQDGSAKVVENLSYPDATGYLDLKPGSYDLKVCAAADNTVCPLDPGALALAGGSAYSVFAVGSLTADSLTAVVAVDGVAAPATDTVGETGSSPSSNGFAAVLLAAAAAFGVVGSLRYAAARTRAE